MKKQIRTRVPRGTFPTGGVTAKWREVINRLKPGESFTVDDGNLLNVQKIILKAAKQCGVSIATHKQETGGLLCRRLK